MRAKEKPGIITNQRLGPKLRALLRRLKSDESYFFTPEGKETGYDLKALCSKCQGTRKEHLPSNCYESFHASGYSSGGGTMRPIYAVTMNTGNAVCLAFIEPGEQFSLFSKQLPPKSLKFFLARWNYLHGKYSKLIKPWFAL
jgi:hypothetical protein